MTLSVWFWQRMVTPHMAYLAMALAERGHSVTYVAEEELSPERRRMGWVAPKIEKAVDVRFVRGASEAEACARGAPQQAIHITQGVRSNGLVSIAQAIIRSRGNRHYVVMETVDVGGLKGKLKQLVYGWILNTTARNLNGVLAIGASTGGWLRRLAPSRIKIVPFAYFLHEPSLVEEAPFDVMQGKKFRFLFVGSLIPLKRVDMLLDALAFFTDQEFELNIVGDGEMRTALESKADELLPGRVAFHGTQPITAIASWMATSDCLVLPSRHDGWGAVISEAVLSGSAVICSSACGAREIVTASARGGVFESGNLDELKTCLKRELERGRIVPAERRRMQDWGRCAGATRGAEYLEALLVATDSDSIDPPWAPTMAGCPSVLLDYGRYP